MSQWECLFLASRVVSSRMVGREELLLNLVNDPFWPKVWHILTKIRESYVIKLSEICVDNDEKKNPRIMA